MITPSFITTWLEQPATFSEADRKDAALLLRQFPYFVPLRMIEAAEHHKKKPFSPAMLNMMQLYKGNWLLFHEFLKNAGSQANESAALPFLDVEEEQEFSPEVPSSDAVLEPEYLDGTTDTWFDGYMDDELNELEEEEDPDFGIPEDLFSEQDAAADPPQTKEKEKPAQAEQASKKESAIASAETPLQNADNKKEPSEEAIVTKEKDTTIPFYQNRKPDSLIQPIYTEDYFLHQGLNVSDQLPKRETELPQEDKSLMVVMSFSEWLMHFKTRGEKAKEEQEDQKALKTMWQKEKLAAALEEENEEIPETVFEMAVSSITKEEDLASESLAEILVKQAKYDKAIEMYRKLSLRNPQKKAYFARKIDKIQKEKEV